MLEAFKQNPTFFFLSFVAALLGLAFVVLGLARASKKPKEGLVLGLVALVLGIAALACGGLGAAGRNHETEAAVSYPGLSSRDIVRMREEGRHQADAQLLFGELAALIPVIGGLSVAGISARGLRRA